VTQQISAGRPRIAYILQDFHIGGMESIIYRIAARLRDRYDFTFIATHVPEILPKFHDVGTAIYLGQDWLGLMRYLRREKIDLVQYGNVRLYADAALAAGVPVVIERTDGLRRGVALRSKAGLDAVVASTRGTIEPISRLIARDKIHLIYNGIDTRHFAAIAPDRLGFGDEAFLIGRVSRFGAGKNIGLLIDAVRTLRERHPSVRLVLVGGGSKMPGAPDEERALRERAQGLEEHVLFTGTIENPDRIIKGFDVGTCISRAGNEGIPNSLIECMAAGKPVVATRVDDIPELVEHERTGLLIDDNDLDGLVAALERLMADPDLRRSLGEAGRERVAQDFDLDAQAEMYDALYRRLLNEIKSPGSLWIRRQWFLGQLLGKLAWQHLVPARVKTLWRKALGKARAMSAGEHRG
jgi:glycosyltransferase involved in cell wall biosynthesis